MKSIKITFDEDQDSRIINSARDLDTFLNDLQTDRLKDNPIIISLEIDDINLSIGLGSTLGFVQVNANNEPPYWITAGDKNKSGVTTFFLHGKHHTEIQRAYLIPLQQVMKIIQQYCQTGLRSEYVNWVEV